MKVCRACKAFVQPTWERCMICGADASGAVPHGDTLPRPTPTGPPRGGSGGSRAGLVVVVLVVVALLGAGGWYVLDQTSDDEEVAGTGASTTTRPPSSGNPKVDAFVAITVAYFSSEGLEVDRACAQTAASRPEHAPTVDEAMDGAFTGDFDDPAFEELLAPVTFAMVDECIGVGNFMAHIMAAEFGISPSSAACVGAAFEADPAMVEAFRTRADYDAGPAMGLAMINCLTPTELEAMATAQPAP